MGFGCRRVDGRIIVIDSREPNKIETALKGSKIKIEKDFLEVGDYLLPNDYVIERKQGLDFINSVKSNRLYNQLYNLCEYKHPILVIIENNIWKDFYFTKGNYIHKSYVGTLTTLTAKYPNLKIIQLDSEGMFIDYLKSLHKKITGDGHSERPAPMFRKAVSINERKENALTCIEGVGMKMSKKLLKQFGSISNIANAREDDMLKIEKLGKKTIKNIKETLN